MIYSSFTEDAHKQWTGHWEECESHWAMALKNEKVCLQVLVWIQFQACSETQKQSLLL